MEIKQQRALSCGLSLINVAACVGTFIFATKEAPSATEKIKSLPKDSSKKDKILTYVKSYKKSFIFLTAAIASGVGSRIISSKTEASLIATASMLDASLRKYKAKVKETLGIDADKAIQKAIAKDEFEKLENKSQPRDGEVLYHEEHIGYFYAKPEDLYKAYAVMNQDFSGTNWYDTGHDFTGSRTLKDFLNYANARLLSHNVDASKSNFGWSWAYLEQFGEGIWVPIDISEPDEDGVREIYWFIPPVWNPEDWDEWRDGNLKDTEYFENCNMKNLDLNSQYYSKN